VIKIDECVSGPDFLPKIFPRHYASRIFEQDDEHLERLFLQTQASAIFAEYSSRQVHFEKSEAQKP